MSSKLSLNESLIFKCSAGLSCELESLLLSSGVFDVWTHYSHNSLIYNALRHNTKAASDGILRILNLTRFAADSLSLSDCNIIKLYHLMQVWGLFAPKFVFDVVGLLLGDLLIFLSALYYTP